MGIKNLTQLLTQKCSVAINERNLESYRGMVFGVDTSLYLYKFLHRNGDHIHGFVKMICRLLQNQILPVFIFDGSPPEEKDGVLKERRKRKLNLVYRKKKLELIFIILKEKRNEKLNIDDYERRVIELFKENNMDEETDIISYYNKSIKEMKFEIEKISKKIIYIRDYHIDICKKLFEYMGIPYINAPCEAESYMAYLCKKRYIDGCISEDTDVLVNGGTLFLRNFLPEKNTVDEYCLDGILQTLNVNYDEFVDICILSGSDYTPKIQGMTSIHAYEYIKKYKTIENSLKNLRNVPTDFNYVRARQLFKNPLYGIDISDQSFDFKICKPNMEELILFIKQNSNIKTSYIEKNLMNYYFDMSAPTI